MIKKIPARDDIYCDRCGKLCEKSDRRQNGHLVVNQDALDYQGCAVADGTVKFDLCDHCLNVVSDAINKAMKKKD